MPTLTSTQLYLRLLRYVKPYRGVFALALTESCYGWSPEGIHLSAKSEREGFVLNGTKRFITAAMVCDVAVVVATTDPSQSGMFSPASES